LLDKEIIKASITQTPNFDEYLAKIWDGDETRDWGFFQKEGKEQQQ
jgi:hypothetical protein